MLCRRAPCTAATCSTASCTKRRRRGLDLRCLLRAAGALALLVSLPQSSARLFGIEVPDGCAMQPAAFEAQAHFYLMECEGSSPNVKVGLIGENLRYKGEMLKEDHILMDVHKSEVPRVAAIESCNSTDACELYTIDVFRKGGIEEDLSMLSVTCESLIELEPNFASGVHDYKASVPLGSPFEIAAMASSSRGKVGIRFVKQGEASGSDVSGLHDSGCSLAEKQNDEWKLPGFRAVGEYVYEVCVVPPGGGRKSFNVYRIKIEARPLYNVDLASIDVGEGFQLMPKFSPAEEVYHVKVDQKVSEVPVTFRAKDPTSILEVGGDVMHASKGTGELKAAVKMHDNSHLREGEVPQWSSTLTLTITSPDGELSRRIVLSARQKVSTYCNLKGLTVGRTPVDKNDKSKHPKMQDICKLTPEFDGESTTSEYKCYFDWTVSTHAMITFVLDDKKCKDCSLYVPDPRREKERQLSLKLMNIRRTPWRADKEWSRKFLYGEYHTLPVEVVSADRWTHRTYHIYFERVAPWWMQTRVTRFISKFASTLAMVMSSFSVTNVMALAKQFQFMSLTTEIEGIPDVYKDFAGSLKVVNLDLGPMMPDFGLPSAADIEEFKQHIIRTVQKQSGLVNGRLLLQYCIAYHSHDRLMANAMLNRHPTDAKELVAEMARIEQEEKLNKTRREANTTSSDKGVSTSTRGAKSPQEISRRLLELFQTGGARGVDLASSQDPGVQESWPGFLAPHRRDLEDGGDDDDDDDGGDEHQAVWDWTEQQWQAMKKKAMKDGVELGTYPLLPCDNPALANIEHVLTMVHELHLFREMLHSTTGTFLILFVGLAIFGTLYGMLYMKTMRGKPMRYVALEPGKLVIFLADYALIGFTSASSALLFKSQGPVTLFFYTPTRVEVQIFCALALVLYPILFVCAVFSLLVFLTRTSESASTSQGTGDGDGTTEPKPNKLVWNPLFNSFTDPACNEMRVTIPSKIPSYIPVLPQVSTRHVRSCIPVLDTEGDPLDFVEMSNRLQNKKAERAKRKALAAKLQELEEQWMNELNAEISNMGSSNDDMKEFRKKKKLEEEEELRKKRGERAKAVKEDRKKRLEEIAANVENADALSAPPWMELGTVEEGCEIVALCDLANGWKSVKLRQEEERLIGEEKFAMIQYIEQRIRAESRLLKYNILTITHKDGYLKPKEPIKAERDEEKAWLWLPTLEDYTDPPGKYGLHPKLFEFGRDLDGCIQSAFGERLVYPGDDNQGFLGRYIPGGANGAKPVWQEEPEEGWDEWEKKHINCPQPTMRYADKWQWLAMEHWQAPWNADEEKDLTWDFLCLKIPKNEGLLGDLQKIVKRRYKERVASEISALEKVEMRKWIWTSLKVFTELKLKLAYVADMSPKFYTGDLPGRGLGNVADLTFHQVWAEIESRVPPEKVLGLFTLKDERHMNNHELVDYAIMKLEDTYPFHEEPWWDGCDNPADGEYKVMFNHDLFWKTEGETELLSLRKNNDLVLADGYFTSPTFAQYMEAEIGKKRYRLLKPDGSTTKVELSIKMGHVLPLMRYTSGFKVNVDQRSLDMPLRSVFAIIIDGRNQGEEFNYVVDRGTTLLSICILSSRPSGVTCALLFFVTKSISFASQLYSAVVAARAEEAAEEIKQQEKLAEIDEMEAEQLAEDEKDAGGGHQSVLMARQSRRLSQMRNRRKSHMEHRKEAQSTKYIMAAFSGVDVTVLFLQSITLFLLCLGELEWAPAPLCALFCILVCSATMIYMNMKTFTKALQGMIKDAQDQITSVMRMVNSYREFAIEWLEGDNFLDYQFFVFDKKPQANTSTADEISFSVPDLGISFTGAPLIDPALPLEERRAMQLTKQIAYYTLKREGANDTRPKSVREHPRYESDIVPSLNVALDVEQMMLRKKIPQCVATIQCLNHGSSKISRTEYDSFLTLFKPEMWEEEDEANPQKVERMLQGWKKQVSDWLEHTLGAEVNERTATAKIEEHLATLLTKDCTGALHRDFYKVQVRYVEIPSTGSFSVKQLEGLVGFVSIVYETESLQRNFPTDRVTCYGKFEQRDAEAVLPGSEVVLRLDPSSEMNLEVPLGVEKIRFCVWAQVADDPADKADSKNSNAGREELICFSSLYEISRIMEETDLQIRLHTQWQARGTRRITPLGGEILDNAEEERLAKIAEVTELKKSKFAKRMDACSKRCKECFEFKKLTNEEIDLTRGRLEVQVREPTSDEFQKDLALMSILKDVTGGDSVMNHGKLERHKDRWLQLARLFGVSVDDNVIEEMGSHLKKMQELKPQLSGIPDKKQREQKILQHDIRRRLEDVKELDKAIAAVANDIEEAKEKRKREREVCGNQLLLRRRIRHRRIGKVVVDVCTDYAGSNPFVNEMLDKLGWYQQMKSASGKQILHYVISSDHLKPNKNWRPDSISPHVSAIVTNQYEDVELVKVTGLTTEDIVFNRETRANKKKDPAMVNGRLVFKSELPVIKNKIAFLYWDGHSRWVISPKRGEPAPYGLDVQYALDFKWTSDSALTPDKIKSPWNEFNKETKKWTQTKIIRVLPRNIPSSTGRKNVLDDAALVDAEGFEAEVEPNLLTQLFNEYVPIADVLNELKSALSMDDKKKMAPELKECLVSLNGSKISFAWKDVQIEKLAPFRKYLLESFGTYQKAWMFLTRNMNLQKGQCQQNLRIMFERTEQSLNLCREIKEAGDDEEAVEAAMSAAGFANMKMSSVFLDKLPSMDLQSKETLDSYLRDEGQGDLAKLAADVVAAIDSGGDGSVNIQELQVLYEAVEPKNPKLKKFQTFLKAHPCYQECESMWADMSENMEICLDEFVKSAKTIMFKFAASTATGSQQEDPMLVSARIFEILDTAMNDKVSLKELIPSSGEDVEDVGKSLLRFDVPLKFLSDIKVDGKKTYGAEQNKAVKLTANPQFVNLKQWRELQLALNPEWKPRENESITIAMRPAYYDLWRSVIMDASMLKQAEYIRFYDGSVETHPIMPSSYMRHGQGTQRWANGQVYSGSFENHVYHGEGSLFMCIEDMKGGASPLYVGSWKNGKRHGVGTMQWEQYNAERSGNNFQAQNLVGTKSKQRGIVKVYKGHFRHDFFHGKGTLYMDKVVAQNAPKIQQTGDAQHAVPPPFVGPTHLVYFHGTFRSDWNETHVMLRDETENDIYRKMYGNVNRELKLEECTEEEASEGDERFKRYFQVDAEKVQKAGWQMPDFAMFAYRENCGELMHLKEGLARYADGSEYQGQFKNKVPDGEGTITQYQLGADGKPTSKMLATYSGQWERGGRHGHGIYKTMQGVEYVGEWRENKRHGKGKQMVPDQQELQEAYGYLSYEGDWEADSKHGKGELLFEVGHKYVGDFENNVRQGRGATYTVEDDGEHLTGNGRFADDILVSTPEEPVWLRYEVQKEGGISSWLPLGGKKAADVVRFYYGQVNKDGDREGEGKLFEASSKDADLYERLLHAAKHGEGIIDDKPWKLCVYEGEWKRNVPDGVGTQCYKDLGSYVGQFEGGQRHGRGVWETLEGWKYSPIADERVMNWQRDLMHGIAIVEDDQNVHENVVYKEGVCQMPFVSKGPPATGFDGNVVVGPVADMLAKGILRSGVKEKLPNMSDGVWKAKDKADKSIVKYQMKKLEPYHVVDAGDEPTLYRDPTDLALPDEDVLICGATGENEVLNGLYFRISGNFGLSIYKHVAFKRSFGGKMNKVTQRYLWLDETKGPSSAKGWWVISDKPKGSIVQGPGMAFVDDNASHPGYVSKSWYVWHSQSKTMKFYSPEGDSPEDVVDNIQSKSIVGFEVLIGSKALGGPKQGLMLRAARSELYGRPVYEAESGGQYMYWLEEGGSAEDGTKDPTLSDEDSFLSSPEEYLKGEGAWIIAEEFGVPVDAPGCLAYCKDISVTPNLTKNEAWLIRMKPYDPSEEACFESYSAFRLRMEECSRADDTLASFDGIDVHVAAEGSSASLDVPK